MGGLFLLALRWLAALAALVVASAIAGAAYQYRSEAADFRRYPPAGRLVDVGGRKLHFLCAGSSAGPAVVIEAGSGNDSTLWEDMVRHVSAFARVCTYDRAGLGWSDPAPGSRTIDDRAADLHALLAAANVPAPYVLVGHSYGGCIVRRFAAVYPATVRGIVLVDAPEEEFSFASDGLQDIENMETRERRLGWISLLGLARLGNTLLPDRFDPVRGVPPEVRGVMTALALCTSRHFARADEMASYSKTPRAWRIAHGFGQLGNMPLVVVSHAARVPVSAVETFPEWQQGQMRLTQLSTASRHVITEGSGHMIQFSEPDIVSHAIQDLLHILAKEGRA
jgi:pimeloyl-ACP methyl ester carboxylesterase